MGSREPRQFLAKNERAVALLGGHTRHNKASLATAAVWLCRQAFPAQLVAVPSDAANEFVGNAHREGGLLALIAANLLRPPRQAHR